jgi:hypothetical protein
MCLVCLIFATAGANPPATIVLPVRGAECYIGDTITLKTYVDTVMLKSIGCQPHYCNLYVSFDDGMSDEMLASFSYMFGFKGRPIFGGRSEYIIDTLTIQDSTNQGYNLSVRFIVNGKNLDSIVHVTPTPVIAIFSFMDEASGKLVRENRVVSGPVYIMQRSVAVSHSKSLTKKTSYLQKTFVNAVTLNGRVLPKKGLNGKHAQKNYRQVLHRRIF